VRGKARKGKAKANPLTHRGWTGECIVVGSCLVKGRGRDEWIEGEI
jgi:hypothetical protein